MNDYMMNGSCLSRKQMRAIATRRLKRDLIELRQQSDTLLCIAAQPKDDNLFEWHANIKPHEGVYSGVIFHLILTFPDSYPNKPPNGMRIFYFLYQLIISLTYI